MHFIHLLPTRRRKDIDTENDRENGLRMNNEITMKEKRFSFFADPQERKAESRPAFGTLPFARHEPTLRKRQRAKSFLHTTVLSLQKELKSINNG